MTRTIVKSDCGHLYATIWIPLISLKAVRMGNRRFQHCPVCRPWAWTEQADVSQLTAEEVAQAQQREDLPIP